MRLVMMGTGPFAVPTLCGLIGSSHVVAALVTRPDRPAHWREKAPGNPMREVARQHGLKVFEPESINSPEAQAQLRELAADLFVVCDYGQILARDTLTLARHGGINLHASLLPKYRGAAPINWAIYHGETETGVTVIHMTPQLDAGPSLVQHRTPIGPTETAPELEVRLAGIGSKAVLEAIDKLVRGESGGIEQDSALATKAPRLKKEDGLVDWSRSATDIVHQVRAMQPWPKTYTFWQSGGEESVRLILEKVRTTDASGEEGRAAGTIFQAHDDILIVACGAGLLQIDAIQPAGKRMMTAGEFLRGHHLSSGDRLTSE